MALKKSNGLRFFFLFILLLFVALPQAQAHVKWFTDGSYADRPLSVDEIGTQLFFILMVVCIIVSSLGVWVDAKISKTSWYTKIDSWLDQRKSYSSIVMRVAAAMLLLLSWQADAMLAPTLLVPEEFSWVGWYQFILAFLLLFPKTTSIAGAGIIGLFAIGNFIFHPFHMLDYAIYFGAGYFLMVNGSKNVRLKSSGLTLLYISVGFSLCWVALEKFVYPDWSLFLLKGHPQLAMGLNFDFFLTSIAFVEFSLGYLLLVCLLQRPLAVLITIVFFLTTTVFGKTEIIGHTLIHGSLIVFLLEGPGFVYKKLTSVFSNLYKRMTFTSVMFLVLLFLLLPCYHLMANNKFNHKQKFLSNKPEHMHGTIELAGYPKNELPNVWMDLKEDPMGGYNVFLNTINFTFSPAHVNAGNVMGEGHAHLHVDGEKVGRIYSNHFYISALSPGSHEISVTLNSNNHDDYTYRGSPIEDKKVVFVK